MPLSPSPGQNNWLEKLNEWGQRSGATINWKEEVARPDGKDWWTETPIITRRNGAPTVYSDHKGEGLDKQLAKNEAAKALITEGIVS